MNENLRTKQVSKALIWMLLATIFCPIIFAAFIEFLDNHTGSIIFFFRLFIPTRIITQPIPIHFVWTLFMIYMLGVYASVIYVCLPLHSERNSRQRWIISFFLAFPFALFLGTILHFGRLALDRDLDKRSMAQFSCPTNPTKNIFFVEQGFRERSLALYASSEGQKKQYIAYVELEGAYHFSHAQWTKDGQAIVCFLNLWNQNETTQKGIVYDFKTNRTIGPLLVNYNAADTNEVDWKEFGLTIQQVIDTHGGLNDQRIDDDMVRKDEKMSVYAQDLEPHP